MGAVGGLLAEGRSAGCVPDDQTCDLALIKTAAIEL